MNKLLLMLTFSLLLLIPIGLSYDFNFNTNVTLQTKDLFGRIYGYFENETLYVSTSYDGNIQISTYDNSFTNLDSTSVECTAYGGTCESFDCVIKENLTLGLGFECIGSEDLVNDYVRMTFITLSTLTQTYLTTGYGSGSTNSLIYPSVSDTTMKIWKQHVSDGDLRYAITQQFGADLTGDGALDIPSSYENVKDAQIRECGGMYHVTISKNGKVYNLIYDFNRVYKTVYLLSPTDWNNTNQEYQYGVSCDRTESPYSLLFVLVNNTYNGGLISLQRWAIGNYIMTNVWSEILNQTNIESLVNGTSEYYINRPFLTKDGYNRYNLFYEYVKPSTNEFKVSYDNSCSCSGWVNTSTCLDNNVLQTRICYPNLCLTEEQYVYSTYCANAYNASLGIYSQETRPMTDSTTFDTGFLLSKNNPNIRRDLSLDIPLNCTNVKVNSTFYLYTKVFNSLLRTNNNNFVTTLCLPTTSCLEDTRICQNAYDNNQTYKKNYDGFIGGETAKATIIVDGSPCQATLNVLFGNEGWVYYGVSGSLTYSCDLICGGTGGYKCESQGLEEYSIFEYPDCSTNVTMKTVCANGCDYSTGRCKGATGAGGAGGAVDSWLTRFTLRGSDEDEKARIKLTYGLLSSLALSIFGLYLVGNSEHNGIILAIGFAIGFIIFTFIGWIPMVFSIIIVFAVGVFGLLKFIK